MIIKKRLRSDAFEDEESPKLLKMIARGIYIPKRNPKKPMGEDAFFICEEEQTMGVADGVGGWAKRGVDSGIYARKLMRQAAMAVEHEPKGYVNVRRVLEHAFLQNKEKGSSTASIVTLKERVLHGVNVGDSGLMVFRNNKLVFQSPIQQHRFNTPYQLGNRNDSPKSAVEYEVKVQSGDIVVLGTDGVWDNVFAHEFEKILSLKNKEGMVLDVQELAAFIARVALKLSLDKEIVSPFSVASRNEGSELHYRGGKVDDITVLVAYITE